MSGSRVGKCYESLISGLQRPDHGATSRRIECELFGQIPLNPFPGSLTLNTPSRCIFIHMARTNIDIDDELVQRVMVRYQLSTKREAVDYALRHLVGQPMTREQASDMLGSLADFSVPVDSGPRDPR